MKSLRFISLVSVLLLTACLNVISVGAQLTNESSIDFAILNPVGRVTYETSGEVQWENTTGNVVRSISSDLDSVKSALKSTDVERRWKISIDRLATGWAHVTVRTQDPAGYPAIFSYADSLAFDETMEMTNDDFLPGINILMDDSVTANTAVGDTIEIVFLRRTLDPHWLSRLTVVPSAGEDTITTSDDSVFSSAVPGNVENMTWFIKGITSDAGDAHGSNYMGLGYQLKIIGEDWGQATTVNDSTYLPQDVLIDTSFVHAMSDSLRLVLWGNGSTTKLYLEFVKWLGGN